MSNSKEKSASKGGPNTPAGKLRASRNALRHGVFSEVVLLRNESRTDYERLFAGLREATQPVGKLEELLVEKLATTAWRSRRLFLAESAEIQKNIEFVECDQRSRDLKEAEQIGSVSTDEDCHGLIQKIDNPDVLERCLELLSELQGQIEEKGFNPEYDGALLERIYGGRDENRLREDLYNSYQLWHETSESSKEERDLEQYASPAGCRKNILREINEEIRRLESDQKARASMETERTQLEVLCHNVPDALAFDRLLRSEANLERNFDRTLSQLERLQRMRMGQPVPPKLEVRHSLS